MRLTNKTNVNYTPRQLKLPLEIEKLIDISDPVYTFCEVMDHIDLSSEVGSQRPCDGPLQCHAGPDNTDQRPDRRRPSGGLRRRARGFFHRFVNSGGR